jgi:hypothetical protein
VVCAAGEASVGHLTTVCVASLEVEPRGSGEGAWMWRRRGEVLGDFCAASTFVKIRILRRVVATMMCGDRT